MQIGPSVLLMRICKCGLFTARIGPRVQRGEKNRERREIVRPNNRVFSSASYRLLPRSRFRERVILMLRKYAARLERETPLIETGIQLSNQTFDHGKFLLLFFPIQFSLDETNRWDFD